MRVIDSHAHVIPPGLVSAMRSDSAPDGICLETAAGRPWVVHRQGYRYPLLAAFHDVAARLAAMDAAGISLAVLSCSPTLFLYWTDAATAADAARLVNDGIADMAAQAPDRFAGVASLPLQDPPAAAAELRRAVRELGLKGAHVGPHVEGVPLDDASLRPVLQTAVDLGVPLIVHPYFVGPSPSLDDFYLTNLQGNPWQTAVCASRLILSGTLDALPALDVMLVHGGGHLPYQIGRLDHGYQVRPEAQQPAATPSAYLGRFHYDTLLYRPDAMRWLIGQVGADRVLYGTDMPFDMDGGPLHRQLGEGLADDAQTAIAYRNAERLFVLRKGN